MCLHILRGFLKHPHDMGLFQNQGTSKAARFLPTGKGFPNKDKPKCQVVKNKKAWAAGHFAPLVGAPPKGGPVNFWTGQTKELWIVLRGSQKCLTFGAIS